MKNVKLGTTGLEVPAIAVGCMRMGNKSVKEMNSFIHFAIDNGTNFFDHANIYGDGKCEELFGDAFSSDNSLKREYVIIQSKCGIRKECYDQSKEHIISSVDGILKRLKTDYIDILLIHRPDALVEPEEVAEAFDELKQKGKVKYFGVSNHKPMQIELLKKYLNVPIVANQMQFSIPVSNMIANGMEVNMTTDGAIDHDGSVLDYCRVNDITMQSWSPLQMAAWKGCFIGAKDYKPLNKVMKELAEKYNVDVSTIATAWILRHPANMQVVTGTANEKHLKAMIDACKIQLSREEWYKLYLSAGHILP